MKGEETTVRGQIPPEIQGKIAEGLSEEQKSAVFSDASYVRIIAAAGAGKTETITRRVLYLLALGEDPASIVAFTFTERAAQEMKERIYRKTGKILGEDHCARLGEMFVGTIHSFALFLLQEQFGFGNYDVLDPNKEMAFLLREGWQLGLGPNARLARSNSYVNNCAVFRASVNVVYDELLDRELLAKEKPDFAKGLQKYEELLGNHKLLTLSRLIYLVTEYLQGNKQILQRYKHLIVDEFQDINKAQEKLIDLLCAHASCFVVGDPRQCIYQWRGSDPRCFDRFADKRSAITIQIPRNRRSARAIVDVANRVAEQFTEAVLKQPMECARKEDGVVLLVKHETPEDEARWLAEQVQKLENQNVCRYRDIAILLRSVATSGPAILDALRARNIPYIVGGKVGLFRRPEAQALGAIFTWCADLDWSLDSQDQQRIPSQEIPDYVAKWWPNPISREDLVCFKQYLLNGKFTNFTRAYQELLIRLGMLDWNPNDLQNAVRLATLGRFNTLVTDFDAAWRLGGRWNDWQHAVKNLAWFILSYGRTAYEEQSAEDLRRIDAVTVTTIHQAKGLEWPIVFVPALVDSRFGRSGIKRGTRRWLVPTHLFEADRYNGTEEDERKLFYVAVTRARDALCLSYFQMQKRRAERSQFLVDVGLQPPDNVPEFVVPQVQYPSDVDEELLTYSTSEIIDYLRCPYLYRLRNLWGYQPGLVSELGFGKTIHHILQILANRVKQGDDPEQVLDDVINKYFYLPFARSAEAEKLKQAASDMLRRYVTGNKKDFFAIEEVEARLEYILANLGNKVATVSGRVDVILSPDGKRELRDYKTAQEPGEGDVNNPRVVQEATIQLSIYAMGEQSLGRRVDKASIAFLSNGVLKPVPLDKKNLDNVRMGAQKAIEGIIKSHFSGSRCPYCADCDFIKICHFYNKSQ